MTVNNRTTNRDYPKPNVSNLLSEDVVRLSEALDDIDGDVAALQSKAPAASPTFTGTPSAPTAAPDTNTTQVATTAFVVGQASAPVTPLDVTIATLAADAKVHPSRAESATAHWAQTLSPQQVQALFNSLFKVLCIFPSRYLFAIGLSPVFSFRRNLPPIQAAIPSNPTLWKHQEESLHARHGTLTLSGAPFQGT